MASTVQDMRKIRMSKFRNLCIVTLPFASYVFYALGGLYTLELDISRLKEQLLWCFMHPFLIYNDKSLPMVALGVLIWIIQVTIRYFLRIFALSTTVQRFVTTIPSWSADPAQVRLRSFLRRIFSICMAAMCLPTLKAAIAEKWKRFR